MSKFINTIDLLGDEAVTDSLISRTITEFKDNKITAVEPQAFKECKALTNVVLPLVKQIKENAFQSCMVLETVDSSVESISGYAFAYCYNLKNVIMRNTEATCGLANTSSCFYNCYHILGTKNSYHNPNGDKDGYFYVPAALVDTYKTRWGSTTYASQLRALEDYTVDGTITGELDPNKI